MCAEYKKKYGEEHGSCQAGIAGYFTEVGLQPSCFMEMDKIGWGKKTKNYLDRVLYTPDLQNKCLSRWINK